MKPFFVLTLTFLAVIASVAGGSPAREACVRAICGLDDQRLNYSGGGSFAKSPGVEGRELSEQVRPAIEDIMDIGLRRARSNLTLARTPPEIVKEKRSPWQRIFSAMATFATFDKELTAQILKNGSGAKMADKLEGWPYAFIVRIFLGGPNNAAASLRGDLAQLKELKGQSGPNFISDFDMAIYEKAAAELPLTDLEEYRLARLILRLVHLFQYQLPENEKLIELSPFNAPLILHLLKPKIAILNSFLNSPEKLSVARQNIAQMCARNIGAKIAASPSPLLLERARQMTEKIRHSSLKVLPRYLSGVDLAKASDALQKMTFVLPEVRALAKSNLNKRVEAEWKVQQEISAMLTGDQSQNLQIMRLLQFMVEVSEVTDEKSAARYVFGKAESLCQSLAPPRLQDSVFSEGLVLLVSWESVLWAESGSGAIAHEIGHMVEDFVSPAALEGPMSCQREQHANIYGKRAGVAKFSMNQPGANQASEDWADTFSVSVQNHLRESWPFVRSLGCMLFPMDISNESFDTRRLDLSNDTLGAYSVSLFRLLRTQSGLGALPPSCLELPEVKGKPLDACAK